MTGNKRTVLAMVGTGLASATLYALVYRYEAEIMQTFTRGDGLYWTLPVIAAFVFSFVHGAFTGYFWDVLGVRPKQPGK